LVRDSGGGLAGTHIGRDELYDLAGKAMSITDGTFHEEVEDVLANDRYAVVLARHRFTRDRGLKGRQDCARVRDQRRETRSLF
jgi:hypothetical protein